MRIFDQSISNMQFTAARRPSIIASRRLHRALLRGEARRGGFAVRVGRAPILQQGPVRGAGTGATPSMRGAACEITPRTSRAGATHNAT